ncbi:glycosyltransferase family 2 protein [Halomonas smyrnensis]|uniref:glycosyltransferase family 2 protein n=1 Tax=Halomonas smyrnensis TaxID=720605 RepID=UPI0009FC487A|nr:glycosyltransferase [Halomonas smyrnensis]
MNPYISLIVPVFNGEAYLRRCVESVIFAANGYSVEIIIVDDGSTDGSAEIAQALAATESCIRYVHQVNHGPSAARNKGLALATGDYIGFLDCDDCIAPSYMYKLIDACEKSPDIIVFGYEEKLLDGSSIVYAPSVNCHRNEADQLLANVSLDRELFWFSWTKLFRAELLSGVNFDEEMRLGEDTIFNIQAVAKAKLIIRVPDVLYSYYETPGSLSSPNYKPGLLENMEKHFAARLRVHEQHGQSMTEQVRVDVCRYYLGHIVPWLVSNAMRMESREQLGELTRIRASWLVTTCFAWGVDVGGSRGVVVMLLLLRFRMLRLLRCMLAHRIQNVYSC